MLTRTPTIFNDGPPDYIIKEDGREIGRVVWTYGVGRETPWFWSITVRVPQAPTDRALPFR